MRVEITLALTVAASIGTSALASDEHDVPERRHHAPDFGGGVRGVTVGPIENALHPERGYGTPTSAATMARIARMGATWVSLTPFGRVWDLSPTGVDHTFEAPFEANRRAISHTIAQAHAEGLRVMLVPHLWVETGGWRGEIDFENEMQWQAWADAYEAFVLTWASIAETTGVELFSVGVELRSWVTTTHAPRFMRLIERVREVYTGPLTYAANWDDAEHTVVWGALDVIGINAFFPLATREGAAAADLLNESRRVAERLDGWVSRWNKPVVFTEVGYTARPNTTLRPWEWPEDLGDVSFDGHAQARAYATLLAPMIDREWFVGFFVWRFYADTYDISQEPDWGFSPLHKPAELVLRSVFDARFAADGHFFSRSPLVGRRRFLGKY